jgi:hypothetical protein
MELVEVAYTTSSNLLGSTLSGSTQVELSLVGQGYAESSMPSLQIQDYKIGGTKGQLDGIYVPRKKEPIPYKHLCVEKVENILSATGRQSRFPTLTR